MTEPVEEAKAPLDDPDEDEIRQPRTLDDISSLEDLETPRSPEDVADAVEEGMESDEGEFEGQGEAEEAEDTMVLPPDEVAEEPEPEPESESEPEPEGHIVKINGEEYRLSTDDLVSGYQQAAASQQKFQKAAEVEKAARTIIDNVLDPNKTVDTMIDLYSDRLDGDREKAAEQVDEILGKRIQHLIDLEEMSEDERKVHDLTAEKERMLVHMESQRAAQEQERARQHVNYQNTQAVPLLDRAISGYNLEVGSAEDVESSQILAEYIRQGHTITQDLANQTVAGVINRRQDLLQTTLSGMSAEDLANANPQLAMQVQQRRAEELKASRTTDTETNIKRSTSRRRKAKKSAEYEDSNEFFNDTDF